MLLYPAYAFSYSPYRAQPRFVHRPRHPDPGPGHGLIPERPQCRRAAVSRRTAVLLADPRRPAAVAAVDAGVRVQGWPAAARLAPHHLRRPRHARRDVDAAVG